MTESIQKPSANTLIDQTLLGQMVDAINNISSDFSRASSSIFDTTTGKSKATYFGGFTFVTLQLEFTQTLKTNEVVKQTKDFSFGKPFASAPLVFATIETDTASGIGSTPSGLLSSAVVSNIKSGGGSVTVAIDTRADKPTIKFRVNILAIGLATL
jgi:hypothetical protein